MILAASEILKIIISMQSFLFMIFLTKLWVNIQQGEDDGFLVLLLPDESYEADTVVE